MALNGFYYEWFWGWARNTDASWSFQVDFGPSYVRAYPVLQQHLENQGDSQTGAKTNIVGFVQGGVSHHGDWQIINGPNISEVTFGLYVNRCFAAGVGNVDIFS
jgi:hypothetical protein